MEKVAIPIWDNRVSPVLDTAASLLVVQLNGKTEQARETYSLPRIHIFQRVRYIRGLNINTVLCGALSRPFQGLLIESGINVFPWITGDVQEVLEAYISGDLGSDKFVLPGCQQKRRGQGRGHRHYGKTFKRNKNSANREEL